MLNNIFALGETVYDIIFKNGLPVSACAGGSILNTSVSLGRCGLPVHFISEYANDLCGNTIDDFLKANKLNTEFVYRYDSGKTSLAIAFLDEHNKADYDFYKKYPSSRLKINIPDFKNADILLFGSYFSIETAIRATINQILNKVKKSNTLIIYDPNFRKAHLDELSNLKQSIIENIEYADIIRASDEDMKLIFNVDTPVEAYNKLNNPEKILIYTKGKNGIHFIYKGNNKFYSVSEINPVSTIAAGDSFNAGIIYSIFKKGITKEKLNQVSLKDWDEIIRTGIDFASEVCLSYENYISIDLAKKILNHKAIKQI